MAILDLAISAAWREAAADLGFGVIAPVSISVNSSTLSAEALVADFGAPSGTIIVGLNAVSNHDGLGSDYFLSRLSETYRRYDRQLFAATLDDWGWFGQGRPPVWFTGKPWS
jgi:hypothetical protein